MQREATGQRQRGIRTRVLFVKSPKFYGHRATTGDAINVIYSPLPLTQRRHNDVTIRDWASASARLDCHTPIMTSDDWALLGLVNYAKYHFIQNYENTSAYTHTINCNDVTYPTQYSLCSMYLSINLNTHYEHTPLLHSSTQQTHVSLTVDTTTLSLQCLNCM